MDKESLIILSMIIFSNLYGYIVGYNSGEKDTSPTFFIVMQFILIAATWLLILFT